MIASVSAKPSHWIDVISSRISGWRVTDSITLPKMYPTPMPGPIVPRPAPTPRAIAFRPSVGSAACANVVRTARSIDPPWGFPSMPSGGCLAEVDGRERGEDEGLQRRDQADFEDEESDRNRERDHAERGDPEQNRQPAAHEQDQQVAGEDVREQSHGQGDDPH